MKKIIFILLLSIVMILEITGCKINENSFVGEKSNILITDNGVTLSIKEDTLTNTGATLIIVNNRDEAISYSPPYEIEIQKDDGWHKINVEIDFNLPLRTIKPNESEEIELNWENGYGKLDKGTYRIIKNVNYLDEDSKNNFFNIAVKFTID